MGNIMGSHSCAGWEACVDSLLFGCSTIASDICANRKTATLSRTRGKGMIDMAPVIGMLKSRRG